MATALEVERTSDPPETIATRHHGWRAWAIGLAGPTLLITVLAWPMMFAHKFLRWDWYVHLWYMWHQSESLRANWVPSLFNHDTSAVFDPHFAFYGGTLYAVGGMLTLLVGSPVTAFAIIFLIAFASVYGGWYWIARLAGLGVWTAHVPGILSVTAPYYMTMVYSMGSWAEITADSMVPVLLASAYTTMRADRLRPAPTLALVVSSVLVFGSHNITLVWSSTVLLVVGSASLVLIPALRRRLVRRGVLRVAGVMLPAVLVNAWFLVPNLAYLSQTTIAGDGQTIKGYLTGAMYLVRTAYLVSPLRVSSDPQVPHYTLELPVLAIGWVLTGLVLLRSARKAPWFRMSLILLAAMVPVILLITQLSLILHTPAPWGRIQFTYRLETYVQVPLNGCVVCVLVLVRRSGRHRWWAWAVVPVLAASLTGALYDIYAHPASNGRAADTFGRTTWTAEQPYHTPAGPPYVKDYSSFTLPQLPLAESYPTVIFPTTAERGDRVTVTTGASPNEYVRTNILGLPQLLRISGARVVGIDATRRLVLRVAADAQPRAAAITVQGASPWPVVLGRILSILGLAGLAVHATAMVAGARRRRALA